MRNSLFREIKARTRFKEARTEEAVDEVSKKLLLMKEHLTIHIVDIERICPSLRTSEEDPEKIGALCESILRYGLLEPLTVRRVCKDSMQIGGIFTLICGYRRLEALKKLGIRKAPCVIVDLPAQNAPEASFSAHSVQITPELSEILDCAEKTAVETGSSFEETCKKLTLDRGTVAAIAALKRLSAKEQAILKAFPSESALLCAAAAAGPGRLSDYAARCAQAYDEAFSEPAQRRVILGDLTPFVNSVEKLVCTARNVGIKAEWTSRETPENYEITIRLPKKSLHAQRSTSFIAKKRQDK